MLNALSFAEEQGAADLILRVIQYQVSKGIWWMPWRSEAMKDVAGCDKLRLGVNTR